MKLNKVMVVACLFASSALAQAETWYDDWNVEIVDVIEQVQHYGGQGVCEFQRQDVRFNNDTFSYETYTYPSNSNFYLADTTEAFPTVGIIAPFNLIDSNGFIQSGVKTYACQAVFLPTTYVEDRVVSQKEVKTPIQPFATFAIYEFSQCVGGTRNGILTFGGANGQNVKVRVSSSGFPNQIIYNGPSQGYIAYNTSSTGTKNVSIKIDSGSSKYLNINIPECDSGGGGPHPF